MIFQKIKSRIKYKFYKIAFRNSPNLFINPFDMISYEVFSDKNYQSHLCRAITQKIVTTRKNLFVDIGANIGLITIQVAEIFDKVICVEPNSVAANVLISNLEINNISNYELLSYALSSLPDVKQYLYIPKNNIGGAYLSDENMYSQNNKDRSDVAKKLVPSILADDFFKEIFEKYGDHKIVIKVDIEGMELEVLKALLRSLKSNLEVSVLYENWSDNDCFLKHFENLKNIIYSLHEIDSSNYICDFIRVLD